MAPQSKNLVAEKDARRLDLYLMERDVGLTRSQVQRLILEGYVLLNGNVARTGERVRAGDRITVTVPEPTPSGLLPEAIPLNRVYDDAHLVVVDKPAGLTVHPSPGHPSHTLVNALLAWYPNLPGIGGERRPGIVHRLDKDTSGLMVVAKTAAAHLYLSRQFKERQVKKGYLALLTGRLEPAEGVIDAPIARHPRLRKQMAVVEGGREARTRYRVLEHLQGFTLVEVFPETGRTHQIRVHFAAVGHPLLGDPVYGKRTPLLGRQFLHAHRLGFEHPVTGHWLEFRSGLPPDLDMVLKSLGLPSAAPVR